MKKRLLCGVLLLVYALLLPAFVHLQKNRPVEVKLGYLPHPQIIKVASGEHRTTAAGLIALRVILYYGTVLQKIQEGVQIRPEFLNVYRNIQTIVALDPYNMDAYYFVQAMFTWDLGRIREVNDILERGVTFRTWDPFPPFYIGFNHAYFLKDFAAAARYMQIAAERSGNPLYTQLAARYFYESEQSALGLAFLDAMIRTAKDKTVRRSYEMRRAALLAASTIEKASEAYRVRYGAPPAKIELLVDGGLLPAIPADPYGGTFYLDADGRVRTTSKLIESKSSSRGEHESY